MRRTTAALTLLFGLAQPLVAQDPVSVTVDQAYVMAINAVQAGDSKQAIKLLNGLIRARPDDPNLHLLQATAYAQLNRPRPARAAAARAYRLADNPSQKVTAAEFAASSALVQNRPTMTQLWLRRAAQHADEKSQEQIAKDYAHVRRINPFSFTLRGGVQPSDNVNSGTDATDHVINGIPSDIGVASDGSALSGTVATLDALLSYRLRQSEKSVTTLGARLYTRRVALSSEAKQEIAADPGRLTRNSDFATDIAEISLDHLIGLGKENGQIGLGLSFGSVMYGGAGLFDYSRLRLSRGIPLKGRNWLSFHTAAEQREAASSNTNDQTRFQIGATFHRTLNNNDRYSIGVTFEEADGIGPNVKSSTATLRGTYTFGQQLGPAEVSTSLTVGYTDFPEYGFGASFGAEPGRIDISTKADISFFFKDYDYAGFAPKVRMQAGRTTSNASFFEAEELSISFEIQSKF
ncbi:MAG: hypothetical protein AAGG57_06455 [Pseudomonadota bacterium]